jgi:ABC-type spermidine/putrescine transport system permease subunit I
LELGFFVTPAVLGGGRVLMIAPIIQKQLDSFSNWGVVAILSTILLAIAVVAVIISEKLIGKARATR